MNLDEGSDAVQTDAVSTDAALPEQNLTDAASGTPENVQDDKSQPSSSEGQGDKKVSLQDKISQAIEDVQKKATASPAVEKQDTTKISDTKTADKDKDEDEDKTAPLEIRNHPAFQKVIAQRRSAKQERDKVLKERDNITKELETYKGHAEQYQQVDNFLKTNGVSYKDAGEALKLAALAYNDPAQFAVKIQELAQKWGSYVGNILPEDLQREVDEGLITESRAQELAKARGQVAIREQQIQHKDQRIAASDSAQEMQAKEQLLDNWMDQVSKTDSAIEKKLPFITDRMSQIRAAEGDPKNVQEVWNRLNRAYQDVNTRLRTFQPPRPTTPSVPQPTGMTRGAIAAPTTFEGALDAALANLGTART